MQWGKNSGLKKTGYYIQMNKTGTLSHIQNTAQSRFKTVKFLEENTEEKHNDNGVSNGFTGITPEAKIPKGKIDKIDHIKVKKLLNNKERKINSEKTTYNNGRKYL